MFGCSHPPAPALSMFELTIPNPEVEALHRKGVLQVFAYKAKPKVDSIVGGDNSFFYHHIYDSLGRIVWDKQGISSWGSSTRYTYNTEGWADSIIYHSCFTQKEKLYYLYFPGWHMALQWSYGVYRYPHIWWKFNADGFATACVNKQFAIYYDYDSLKRLSSEVTVNNSDFGTYYRDVAAIVKSYAYASNNSVSSLKMITEVYYDEDTTRLKQSSIKRFDSNGLPYEQLFDDGTRLYFSFSDSLEKWVSHLD